MRFRPASDDFTHATRSVALAILWLGILSLGILPGVAFAQYSMIEDTEPKLEWRGRLQALYQSEFETDTDGGDEFESWRLGVSGDFGGPINESILVGFHAGYAHAEYDFNLDNAAVAVYGGNEFPKEPWGGLDTIDLMPTATILVGDRFTVVGAVPIRWSGEVGSERNGFSAGISGIAAWQVVDSFKFGIGIGVTSQVEDSTETFPIIAVDWQLTDGLRLATEGSWIQGGSAGLFWEPSEALSLSFSVGYERNRFRLDDNGTTPDTNGVAEITAVPIEVGLRLRIVEGAYLDLRGGLGVAGRFRVENDRGHKLYDQNYDPAPRLRVALRVPIGAPARTSPHGRQSDRPSDWPSD